MRRYTGQVWADEKLLLVASRRPLPSSGAVILPLDLLFGRCTCWDLLVLVIKSMLMILFDHLPEVHDPMIFILGDSNASKFCGVS